MYMSKKNEVAELADRAEEYGAPFPIYSHYEGDRYISMKSRELNPPRCLDFELIQSLGAIDAVDAYCRTLGWDKFVKMKHHGYQQLMLEFYTTFNFISTHDKKNPQFSCRLMGKNVTVSRQTLCDIFGFYENGHTTAPEQFDPAGFWKEISGRGDYKYTAARLRSGLIRDPVLLIMHKYISHLVFGKLKTSWVAEKDLFYLWCLRRKVGVCTPTFLFGTFKFVAHNPRVNLCLGDFITAIGVHFGVFDPENTGMTVLPTRALDLVTLQAYQICDSDTKFKDFKERKCYKEAEAISTPTVEMENEKDKAIFELEEKINGLRDKNMYNEWLVGVYQRKYERSDEMVGKMVREIEDLRLKQLEGNRTIEELRLKKIESDEVAEMYKSRFENLALRIKKIEKGLVDMSTLKVGGLADDLVNVGANLGKNDGSGNGNTPVDAEDVVISSPGVPLTLNITGSRSKGLSKTGNRNSVQPRTIKDDDDAHNTVKTSCDVQSVCIPPRAENNECKEPLIFSGAHVSGTHPLISGAGHSSKITPSSSNAENIIEIIDSDDEANPDGATNVSNVGENEINFVWSPTSSMRRKRNPPDCTEDDLIVNSTTKRGKNTCTSDEDIVLIQEKENEAGPASDSQTPVEKSDGVNADVFTDSCTDLLATLKSKKRNRECMCEADMLRTLQCEEELCMNAVCALYRKHVVASKSKEHPNMSKNEGFSLVDSVSGCTLAGHLVDGDRELGLRKSVSEVKKE